MEQELIITLCAAAGPAITAIVGCIVCFYKLAKFIKTNVLNRLNGLTTEIRDSKQYEGLKAQLQIAHKENAELRKKMNQILTKLDHVDRKE